MTLTSTQLGAAAAMLRQAERTRRPIAPLVEQYIDLDLTDAYAIQQANIDGRLAAGAVVRGHKVGLTAKAMQELLGVDEPDYGYILDDMVFLSGAEIPIESFLQPRVEPEITFLLREPLRGPGVTVNDVLAATQSVMPSLEIVDSRIADWKITLADTIADNASSAGIITGTWVPLADAPSLPGIEVELLVNGEVVSTGNGAAVLGDPAIAVAWLANTLGAFDVTLEAGHLVMPGSCTSAPFIRPGDHVEAHFTGLGTVSTTFVGGDRP